MGPAPLRSSDPSSGPEGLVLPCLRGSSGKHALEGPGGADQPSCKRSEDQLRCSAEARVGMAVAPSSNPHGGKGSAGTHWLFLKS